MAASLSISFDPYCRLWPDELQVPSLKTPHCKKSSRAWEESCEVLDQARQQAGIDGLLGRNGGSFFIQRGNPCRDSQPMDILSGAAGVGDRALLPILPKRATNNCIRPR